MTQEEFIAFQERNLIAFCKRTIKNLSAYAMRTKINSQKRNEFFDDTFTQQLPSAAMEDDYQTYGRCFNVRGISLVVRDEIMGECLQFIPPNKRAVLLLSFFGECSDVEIAKILGISKATVIYRKTDALNRLRALMEAAGHEK